MLESRILPFSARDPMCSFRPGRFSVLLFCACILIASAACAQTPAARQYLDGTWRMQSSCVDSSKAEQISAVGFDASKWIPAEVPGTVVGAQVTDKVLPDPNYGMNLKSFPGFVSDTKGLFATRDMPADSPYRCSFWFRTEFAVANSSRPTPLAAFPRHQLSCQRLAERQKNCRQGRRGGRLPRI